ncbi:histidine kinase [Enterococcus sp. JM4C]|uniref:sensor histidine kinase n=1 Tax=Candidatus Enterococcus huntleyi TaxID=1857217 RepID=UPI00137A2F25|nr:sensor histidine kinase [Enterococcus sp. JM4C]KAF1299498.1 histidine kinase [Enterococcus sp. JM4C]
MNFRLFLNKINRYPIRQQLFIIFVPLVLLSTLAIGLILTTDSTQQLTENYKGLAAANARRVKSIVFDTTNSFKRIAGYMSTDYELRNILSAVYTTEDEALLAENQYTYLNRLHKQETSIYNLTIYSTNKTLTEYKSFSYATPAIQSTTWFKQATSQPNEFWTIEIEDAIPKLTLYMPLPLPLSEYKSVLKMEVDYNYLKNRITNSSYYTEIQLNNQKLLYSDTIQQAGEEVSFPIENHLDEQETFQSNNKTKDALVAINTLDLANDQDHVVIYSVDYSAYKNLRSNVIRWISILIVVLLMTSLVMIIFANFFSSRIKNLQTAVYHASIEDYDFFKQIDGADEISKISLDFHTITQRIKQKEEQIFQGQLSEKELLNQQQQMEFRLLAGQINPHFLFNTLETIRMTALKNGNPEVAQSVKLLSKSMRFTLDYQGKKITTLAEEIETVKVYTDIQKMRFGDRVNFEMTIADTIDPEQIELLPLLIQPLVENAIAHGLEGIEENGLVTLTIDKQGQKLIIEVEDNGIGISPAHLDLIREQIAQNDLDVTKHIGLRNVSNRIKMFYGDDYGLSIRSQEMHGTKVQIIINSLTTY